MIKSLHELVDKKYYPFYGCDNEFFKLGKNVFQSVCDPDDGYRSSLEDVPRVDAVSDSLVFSNQPFVHVKVVFFDDGEAFSYKLVDKTGHCWLEMGTDYTDNWYPMYIFRYTPKESDEYSTKDR